MRIRLIASGTSVEATLADHETARDFASLLPLTLDMNDLFGREKYGHLPRALGAGGPRQQSFEVGDVAYWPPGPDVAVFYDKADQSIPLPGVTVLAKIDSGAEALKAFDDPFQLTIEAVG